MIIYHVYQCQVCKTEFIMKYIASHKRTGGIRPSVPMNWTYLEGKGYYCPKHVLSVVYVDGNIKAITVGEKV